jgi:hypothetical protein
LLLYRFHTECSETKTLSITKCVIETKRNVRSTWNKLTYITSGQIVRSLKQNIMWPNALLIYGQISGTFWTHYIYSMMNLPHSANCNCSGQWKKIKPRIFDQHCSQFSNHQGSQLWGN